MTQPEPVADDGASQQVEMGQAFDNSVIELLAQQQPIMIDADEESFRQPMQPRIGQYVTVEQETARQQMINDAFGKLVSLQPCVLNVEQFGDPNKSAPSTRPTSPADDNKIAFKDGGWPNAPCNVKCHYCEHQDMTQCKVE